MEVKPGPEKRNIEDIWNMVLLKVVENKMDGQNWKPRSATIHWKGKEITELSCM